MTTATPKLTMLRRAAAMAAAFAAMTVATTSFAAPVSGDAPSIAVRYDDLNLGTTAGVNALYHRIRNAASQVCPRPYTHDVKAFDDSRRCQASAIAEAVHSVNSSQLAALHAARISHG
jgi:UrcA family protein